MQAQHTVYYYNKTFASPILNLAAAKRRSDVGQSLLNTWCTLLQWFSHLVPGCSSHALSQQHSPLPYCQKRHVFTQADIITVTLTGKKQHSLRQVVEAVCRPFQPFPRLAAGCYAVKGQVETGNGRLARTGRYYRNDALVSI